MPPNPHTPHGLFHKTLPHDQTSGEVDRTAAKELAHALQSVDQWVARGRPGPVPNDLELIPRGLPAVNGQKPVRFTSPLAGAAAETLGPNPEALMMPPPPAYDGPGTAAEMVELYWMAALRDVPLAEFPTHPDVGHAVTETATAFNAALASPESATGTLWTHGGLRLGLDLPATSAPASLNQSRQTLFRCGLKGEEHGPLVSQFFLRDIPYGVQTISSQQYPYVKEDFLTQYADWYRAQNQGSDAYGRGYSDANHFSDASAPGGRSSYYGSERRYMSTLRDLARFVNRDALHQAYFNAALFLDAAGATLDAGNPYGTLQRSGGFATLGGPDLLTLVSEVASRGLKMVWPQKWLVHRRARPEVYGGQLHLQMLGEPGGTLVDYGLPTTAAETDVGQALLARTRGHFLPIAYSAGSPPHPAYGAGHATVAGACVTLLKAWFDEDVLWSVLIDKANIDPKEPDVFAGALMPGALSKLDPLVDGFDMPGLISLGIYPTADQMTVGGELNKLAANVAMGRSMGGVHWRSDNTRSLRLGEALACYILHQRMTEYAEPGVQMSFTSFDRKAVMVNPQGVSIGGGAPVQAAQAIHQALVG